METTFRIEPCFPDPVPNEVVDLIAKVSRAAAPLGERLDRRTAASLAALVRIMNGYYSNLIEGHNTLPRAIEAAVEGHFSADRGQRNLQIEARNHVRLQQEIDRRFTEGTLPDAASVEFLSWLHAEFYREMPEEFRKVSNGKRTLDVIPGQLRSNADEEVSVGSHVPPAPQYVGAFMARFAERFAFDRLGDGERIIGIATAHHRFNYIHPFIDGNGRVSRLMSHAMALKAGIGAHGLWSISRGLARGLDSRTEYKAMMEHADTPRQGDLDGRGNLSQRGLVDFTVWFLKVVDDQLTYMASLYDLPALEGRLHRLVEVRGWREEAALILEHVLRRGDMPRGEAARITGLGVRSASDLLNKLVADGILKSDTPKGPVFLRFGTDTADTLFPRLFPET